MRDEVGYSEERRCSDTNPLYHVSRPKSLDFPLLNVRFVNRRRQVATYEPPSLLKSPGRTTTNLSRVFMDIEVGLRVQVLDLVDPRLQFSVLEDGCR